MSGFFLISWMNPDKGNCAEGSPPNQWEDRYFQSRQKEVSFSAEASYCHFSSICTSGYRDPQRRMCSFSGSV